MDVHLYVCILASSILVHNNIGLPQQGPRSNGLQTARVRLQPSAKRTQAKHQKSCVFGVDVLSRCGRVQIWFGRIAKLDISGRTSK